MAASNTKMSARSRARAAHQELLAARAVRDKKNLESLTTFFAAQDRITAARREMAGALADIREREGTLGAAAALTGVTLGEARKLLAALNTTAPDTDDDSTDGVAADETNETPTDDGEPPNAESDTANGAVTAQSV